MSTDIKVGQEWTVSGRKHLVLADATSDGQPGLWWVCRPDESSSEPFLRDAKFLLAGEIDRPDAAGKGG